MPIAQNNSNTPVSTLPSATVSPASSINASRSRASELNSASHTTSPSNELYTTNVPSRRNEIPSAPLRDTEMTTHDDVSNQYYNATHSYSSELGSNGSVADGFIVVNPTRASYTEAPRINFSEMNTVRNSLTITRTEMDSSQYAACYNSISDPQFTEDPKSLHTSPPPIRNTPPLPRDSISRRSQSFGNLNASLRNSTQNGTLLQPTSVSVSPNPRGSPGYSGNNSNSNPDMSTFIQKQISTALNLEERGLIADAYQQYLHAISTLSKEMLQGLKKELLDMYLEMLKSCTERIAHLHGDAVTLLANRRHSSTLEHQTKQSSIVNINIPNNSPKNTSSPINHSISKSEKKSTFNLESIKSSLLQRATVVPPQLLNAWSKQFDELSQGKSIVNVAEFTRCIPFFEKNDFGKNIFVALSKAHNDLTLSLFRDGLKCLVFGDFESKWQFGYSLFDGYNLGFITYATFKTTICSIFFIIDLLIGEKNPTYYSQYQHGMVSATQNLDTLINNLFYSMSRDRKVITRNDYRDGIRANGHMLSVLGLINTQTIPSRQIATRIGYPVSFGHPSWKRVITMMAGISRTLINIPPPVTYFTANETAFVKRYEYQIPTEKYQETVRFIAICPEIFRELRRIFGVNENEFRKAFSVESIFGHLLCGSLATLTEKITDGKSGNFFYCSSDGLFLAKTISTAEYDALKSLLPNYYSYMCENENTLLTRMYGLFKMGNVPFIIMESVFKTSNEIHLTYDLKGSSYGRTGSRETVLKDLDWLHSGKRLHMDLELSYILVKQIEKDSQFLRSNDIIDYSLIVGICDHEAQHYDTSYERSIFQRHSGGIASKTFLSSNTVYYVGIIDCLITYNMKKKAEKFIKTLYTGDEESLSVTHPEHYSDRFLEFFKNNLL